jgi:hypothetical protein
MKHRRRITWPSFFQFPEAVEQLAQLRAPVVRFGRAAEKEFEIAVQLAKIRARQAVALTDLPELVESLQAREHHNNAQLIGVAFFDFFHHQTGVAPNEIELHPLLAFRCLA